MSGPGCRCRERASAECCEQSFGGWGTITPLRFFGALAVLAGVILGLGRAPQVPSGTANHVDRGTQPSAGALTAESLARSRRYSYADAARR